VSLRLHSSRQLCAARHPLWQVHQWVIAGNPEGIMYGHSFNDTERKTAIAFMVFPTRSHRRTDSLKLRGVANAHSN
jgi:hypothetical protein